LRKGAVVQLNGRVSAKAYQTNTGDMAASLNFHTSRIEVLSYAERNNGGNTAAPKAEGSTKGKGKNNKGQGDDDLPF
jgi:single-strand DNA-binding protein